MAFWLRCDRCPAVAPFDEETVRERGPFGLPGAATRRTSFPKGWQTLQLGGAQFHLCPKCRASMEAWVERREVLDG